MWNAEYRMMKLKLSLGLMCPRCLFLSSFLLPFLEKITKDEVITSEDISVQNFFTHSLLLQWVLSDMIAGNHIIY